MNFAQDQAVALKAAERLREHLLRNPADFPLQRRVALSSVGQDLDDERGPFIRDPVQDDARRTLGLHDRGARRGHPPSVGSIGRGASGE